eukprot:gene4672-5119_t
MKFLLILALLPIYQGLLHCRPGQPVRLHPPTLHSSRYHHLHPTTYHSGYQQAEEGGGGGSRRQRTSWPSWRVAIPALPGIFLWARARSAAVASAGLSGPVPSSASPGRGLALWALLFLLSAVLHSAESAITKISPWKVAQFAEEEGPKSPFATLHRNITSLLTTILLATTACSIYSTALFVASVAALCPRWSLGSITASLTVITLFAGELLPKALAVHNSELVARSLVPVISRLTALLLPITSAVTVLSDLTLRLLGLRSEEDRAVSEDMLRKVVEEAQRSGAEGIETTEGRMIQAVLDMEDKEVGRIVTPRVNIVAASALATAEEVLSLAVQCKYSRLPVYRGDIDHIVGVIFSKDLLDHFKERRIDNSGEGGDFLFSLPDLRAEALAEQPAYFIPETMSCRTALQELRKRRLHMAIVVDEFGGTSGLVTLEDLLEEVVGEIYDEDDDVDDRGEEVAILRMPDQTFHMKASASLDDVCEALGLTLLRGEDGVLRGEYSTLGGLLCAVAGRIPQEGEVIPFAGYLFSIERVEDSRRLISILARRDPLVPSTSTNSSAEKADDGGSSSRDVDDAVEEVVFQDGQWVDPPGR